MYGWILVGLIGIILLGVFLRGTVEGFAEAPLFMTKQQTYHLIREDTDGYIGRMPLEVVEGRGFPSHEAYLREASKVALTFSTRDQRFLSSMAPEIDGFLQKHYGAKDVSAPWVFALTEGKTYELGIPHVREGVIMLSTHTLDIDLKDDCSLAWMLLYLRQNILFGKAIARSEMPWKATERAWAYRRRLPTCKYWDSKKITPDEGKIEAVRIWNKAKGDWDIYVVPGPTDKDWIWNETKDDWDIRNQWIVDVAGFPNGKEQASYNRWLKQHKRFNTQQAYKDYLGFY